MPKIVLDALEAFLAVLRACFNMILELLLLPFRLLGAAIHRPSPLQIAAEAIAAQAPILAARPTTRSSRRRSARGRERHELAALIRQHAENAAAGIRAA